CVAPARIARSARSQASLIRVRAALMLTSRREATAARRAVVARRYRQDSTRFAGAATSGARTPPELAPASHAVVGAPTAAPPAASPSCTCSAEAVVAARTWLRNDRWW